MVIREIERHDNEQTEASQKARQKGSYRMAEKKVSVTISIGVAEKTKNEKPDDIMKRADESLYRAKKAGRNRIAT
jgi:diguanylate cyclase (GGDEF)-like protein